MQCLPSHRPFPYSPLGEDHGSRPDPLRFPLSLNAPNSYSSSCRNPYLSPPMSGSPPPKHNDPSYGSSHRRRSNTPPIAIPSAHQLPDHLTAYPGHNPGAHQAPATAVSATRQAPSSQPLPPLVGLQPVQDGLPPHLLPAFGAASSIPPRTTTLPPRSTRRAKAHVASACVNCKRKHLGCDSSRPCRRCVLSGKEETCVDVTHKRRGRPPLKAEEGPIRSYESTYGHSGILRVAQHPSALSTPRSHRRTSSSREIRPNPSYQPQALRPFDDNTGQRIMQPPAWTPPILPSPSSTMPSAPLIPVSLSPKRPGSSGQPLATCPPTNYRIHTNVLPKSSDEISPLRALPRENIPGPHSPHVIYKPQSPSDSAAYLSSPGGLSSYSVAHPPGEILHASHAETGFSSFRLPPILPRATAAPASGHAKSTERPKSFSGVPRYNPEQSQTRPHPKSAPIRPGSPLRRDAEISPQFERRMSSNEYLPMTPISLPPVRQGDSRYHHHQPQQQTQSQPPPPASHTLQTLVAQPTTSPTAVKRSSLSMHEGNDVHGAERRPAKRLRMELGEMVND